MPINSGRRAPRLVPSWDDYYIGMCFFAASRSKDPEIQVGAFVVDQKYRPKGFGYNGPPQSIKCSAVSWDNPDNYVNHAEENAITHSYTGPDSLKYFTMYVSEKPCSRCVKSAISVGISKIIYGPQKSGTVNSQDWEFSKELVKLSTTTLEAYTGNINWVRDRIMWMERNASEVFEANRILI